MSASTTLCERPQGRPRSRRRARLAALVAAAIAPLVVTGLALVAGPAPASGTAAAACPCKKVLFQDYFNTSPDSAWKFLNRAARIHSGRLIVDGGYLPSRVERDGWAMTHVGDRTWRNYVFSTSFDTTNATGGQPEVHQADLFFRVIKNGSQRKGTFYRVLIWDPGVPDPAGQGRDMSKGLVQLLRYRHGHHVLLDHRFLSNTVTGTNLAEVKADGKLIVVRINGKRILRVTDPAPLRYGGVGVGKIWETDGWFDNVRVVRLG